MTPPRATFQVFIAYAPPDQRFLKSLEAHLAPLEQDGSLKIGHAHKVSPGSEWERDISEQLEAADLILPLLSADFLAAPAQRGYDVQQIIRLGQSEQTTVAPVIVRACDWEHSVFGQLKPLPDHGRPIEQWRSKDEAFASIARAVRDLVDQWRQTPRRTPAPASAAFGPLLEHGAMKADSPYFIERGVLRDAERQLRTQEPTVTIRGPRKAGKSSLLVRLAEAARKRGERTCRLDFQNLGEACFASSDRLLWEIADCLAERLNVDADPGDAWESTLRSPPRKLTRFVERSILSDGPLTLLLDETDRIFSYEECRRDLFPMLRSWHNQRSESPLWDGFRLVVAHAGSPAQWITDPNQSTFNVGAQLRLRDFQTAEALRLNSLYNHPVPSDRIEELLEWVSGHAYLLRAALCVMAERSLSIEQLEAVAFERDGPLAAMLEHFRRWLEQSPQCKESVKEIMRFGRCHDENVFDGLWSAGLVRGECDQAAMRCRLLEAYFTRRLR